jgi:hypothetical protein
MENEIGKIGENFQNNQNFVNFEACIMESLHFLVYLKLYQHLETKFCLLVFLNAKYCSKQKLKILYGQCKTLND